MWPRGFLTPPAAPGAGRGKGKCCNWASLRPRLAPPQPQVSGLPDPLPIWSTPGPQVEVALLSLGNLFCLGPHPQDPLDCPVTFLSPNLCPPPGPSCKLAGLRVSLSVPGKEVQEDQVGEPRITFLC